MKKMVEYGRKNFKPLAITTVLLLIYFLPYLNNMRFGLDTGSFIISPGTTLNWLEIGRQGAILLNKIFYKTPEWSIFFVEAIAFIALVLALICFCYLLHILTCVEAWKTCFFFLLFMICPIWIEQFYYQCQIFNIAVGVLLVPICLFLAYHPKKYCWTISILLMLVLFSIYQTFIIVYIAGCLLCFLLLYYDSAPKNKNKENYYWLKLGIQQFLIFLIGFVANMIITSKFFMPSDYLTGQKLWGKIPVKDCIRNILAHIYVVFTGEGIFYTRWFTLSVCVVIILCLIFLWRHRQYKEKIWFCFALLLLQTTPFLLTIYNANRPATRSLFIYPFTFACDSILLLTILPDMLGSISLKESWKKYVLTAVYICSVFVLTRQYYDTSRVQYTTFYVWQSDERMAYRLEERIIEETSVSGIIEKPIALVGHYTHPNNGMLAEAEVPQLTNFSFVCDIIPRFSGSNSWAMKYMNALGIPVSRASDEQITVARIEAQTMSIFPSKGSIRDMGDYIIVKIGNDPWYEEDGLPPVT